jgi:serine phosphatase RsbU (regulator of sigma subunit)
MLANLLVVRGDYEGALKMAVPVAEKMEAIQCDTTSDYVNLLIYIGCSQAGVGKSGEATLDGFDRAYQKHLDNIQKHRDDASYKDAIAGLINISVACNTTKHYQDALKWTGHFGELLSEYEQRPEAGKDYIDKQLARFHIYQAQAYEGLEKPEDANKAYEAFLTTQFSKTAEGRILANDYLVAAQRCDEAADNYRSLDAHLGNLQGGGYTIYNIKNLVLPKYQANLLAGRRDSALVVSRVICDSLPTAFGLADRLDAEEQAVVVKKVEELGESAAKASQQRYYLMFGFVALLFLGFLYIGYMRSRAGYRLKRSHENLKSAYEQLEEATAIKERGETEQRIAAAIRHSMIPGEQLQHQFQSVFSEMMPGQMTGSDLCETQKHGDSLFFCIGNAVGEGVQNAVTMAMVGAQFRSLAALGMSPEKMMAAINTVMSQYEDRQLKLFVGELNLQTGQLVYCNAGLNMPLLMDKEVSQLPCETAKMVGVQADTLYSVQEMNLTRGKLLFFFTDGMTSAENATGKPFGEKALRGAALQAFKLDPTLIGFAGQMKKAVRSYTAGAQQKNDMTMLVVTI